MGRYDGPDWLTDAKDTIRATVGVTAIEHDSGDDYRVFVSEETEKSTVMSAIENLYSDDYRITISPTKEDDWFFVSIRSSDE